MALYEINGRMKQKRDTAANWEAKNPVILNGEIVLVDTSAGELRAKIGDGVKKYLQLPFSDEVLRNLITDKANKSDIPTKVSELTNDSNFITKTGAPVQSVNGQTGDVEVTFYVTITQTDTDTFASTADKTILEIYQAYQKKMAIYGVIYLVGWNAPIIAPLTSLYANDGEIIVGFSADGQSDFSSNPLIISAVGTLDNWLVKAEPISRLSDIPTSLKNPNAITFTGASTGTYDGSSALTINIPASGADTYTQFTQVVISLPLSGWTGASTFTNTIAISSVKADTIVVASPAPSDKDAFAFSNVYCSAQAKGSLTFTAKTKPATDLTANLIIVTLPEGATAAANTCSLTVAGWSSNTQTVSLTGMAADRIAIIGPVANSIDVCKTNAVYCSAQGNGTLTFKCQTTPSVAITMNVIMI